MAVNPDVLICIQRLRATGQPAGGAHASLARAFKQGPRGRGATLFLALALGSVAWLLSPSVARAGELDIRDHPDYAEGVLGPKEKNLTGLQLIREADIESVPATESTAGRGVISMGGFAALYEIPPRLVTGVKIDIPGQIARYLTLSPEEMVGTAPSPYFEVTGTSENTDVKVVIPSRSGGAPETIDAGTGAQVTCELAVDGEVLSSVGKITPSQLGAESGTDGAEEPIYAAEDPIHFSDESGHPLEYKQSYEWRFGDGDESPIESSFHTYKATPENGTQRYVVFYELTREDEFGDVSTGVSFLPIQVRTTGRPGSPAPPNAADGESGAGTGGGNAPFPAGGPAEMPESETPLAHAPMVPSVRKHYRRGAPTESGDTSSTPPSTHGARGFSAPGHHAPTGSGHSPAAPSSSTPASTSRDTGEARTGEAGTGAGGTGDVGTGDGPSTSVTDAGHGGTGGRPGPVTGAAQKGAPSKEVRGGPSREPALKHSRKTPPPPTPEPGLMGVLLASTASAPAVAVHELAPTASSAASMRDGGPIQNPNGASSLAWSLGTALAFAVVAAGALGELRPSINPRRRLR